VNRARVLAQHRQQLALDHHCFALLFLQVRELRPGPVGPLAPRPAREYWLSNFLLMTVARIYVYAARYAYIILQVRELRSAVRPHPAPGRPPGPFATLAASLSGSSPGKGKASMDGSLPEGEIAARFASDRGGGSISGGSSSAGATAQGGVAGGGTWARGLQQHLAGWVQLGPSPSPVPAGSFAGGSVGGSVGGRRRAVLSGNNLEWDREVVLLMREDEDWLQTSMEANGARQTESQPSVMPVQRFVLLQKILPLSR
jgi:hypothetical protein